MPDTELENETFLQDNFIYLKFLYQNIYIELSKQSSNERDYLII